MPMTVEAKLAIFRYELTGHLLTRVIANDGSVVAGPQWMLGDPALPGWRGWSFDLTRAATMTAIQTLHNGQWIDFITFDPYSSTTGTPLTVPDITIT